VKKLRASCPTGWSVKESAGSINLRVRKYRQGATTCSSVTLPLAWAGDQLEDAKRLILELKQAVDAGRDLRDALALQRVDVAPATGAGNWLELVDAYRVELTTNGNEIKPTTWSSSYSPALTRMVELMTSRKPPADARELTAAVSAHWKGKARARELAVNAIKGCLAFGVETKRLPAETWTLTDRAAKQLKGRKAPKRTVASPSDVELLQLIDGISNESWRNVLRLLALYGLRPEELNHLQIREHPDTGKPAIWCSFRKTCGAYKTEPRWLMPLPLADGLGEQVQWNLAGAMAAGLLELPPLGDKYALRTFLERQQGWHELKERYDSAGEWLRPGYSFRNAYSLRAHRAGHRLDVVCLAMGHSLATHQANYEWARDSNVLAYI
jgi:integrase